MKTCTWTEDSEGNWETDCGEEFEITCGTPKQNQMNFCCYCGKPLKEERFKE